VLLQRPVLEQILRGDRAVLLAELSRSTAPRGAGSQAGAGARAAHRRSTWT